MTILPKKKISKDKNENESYHRHAAASQHHQRHWAAIHHSFMYPSGGNGGGGGTVPGGSVPLTGSGVTSVATSTVDVRLKPGGSQDPGGEDSTPDHLIQGSSSACGGASLVNSLSGISKKKRRKDNPLSFLKGAPNGARVAGSCGSRLELLPSEGAASRLAAGGGGGSSSGYSAGRSDPAGPPPPPGSPEHNNSEDEYESQQEVTNAERELVFERTLKSKKGFLIKKMKEDGACLFRAISDQIYGDQDMHSIVRNHVCDYMAKNSEFFRHFVTEDFDRYIERKRVDSSHGNHVELQAISEMYNRPIEIYAYSHEPCNVFQHTYHTDNAPIRLSYHNNMHYNSVVDPYAASVGVGLGLPDFKPGLAEKSLVKEGLRTSESFYIEQAMFEDKVRETDWQATNDAISEAVLRESQLQFLRDQEKQRQAAAAAVAAAAASSASSSANGGAAASCRSPQWSASASSSSSGPHKTSGGSSGVKPNRGSKPGSPAHTPPPPFDLATPGCDGTGPISAAGNCSATSTSSATSPRHHSAATGPDLMPRVASPLAATAGCLGGSFDAPIITDSAMAAPASNQEYVLMKALVESQIEYYNSLRKQHSPKSSSPKPGPSSASQ